MASRVLGPGGDHPNLKDWEAWVTNPANFPETGNWDAATNGGEQILRVADQGILFTSLQALDLDALVTATNHKVTIRPNFEGGATAVGAKVAADGSINLATVDKNPSLYNQFYNHQYVIDISNTSNVEWHIQDITIRAGQHRTGLIRFPGNPTRHIYIDRCLLYDRSGGGEPNFNGGPVGAAAGRIHIRSCFIDCTDNTHGMVVWWYASGIRLLGNTIRIWPSNTTAMTQAWNPGDQLPVDVYGNVFYLPTADGDTNFTATTISAASFPSNFNVSNLTGANWTSDFDGAGDVNNSTRASMFVSSTNQYPKENGALHGVVTWSGLPAVIQAVWPDKDFLGATITKSGAFSAGAIYVPGAVAPTPITGTGAVTLRALVVAALGAAAAAGSGGASLRGVAVAGVGSPSVPGQGAAPVVPLGLAASGTTAAPGQGAASLARITAAGAGTSQAPGGGQVPLSRLVAAGAGSPLAAGSGAAAQGRLAAAGAGAVTVSGQGDIDVAPLSVAASVVVELRGGGLVVVERIGVVAVASSSAAGTGSLAMRPILLAGTNQSVEPDDIWEIVLDAETSMTISARAELQMEVAFPAEPGMACQVAAEEGFEWVDRG